MSYTANAGRYLRLSLTLGIAFSSLLQARELQIRGRLLDHDGRPLVGAEVRLHRWLSATEMTRRTLEGHLEPEAVAAVSSGDDGRFRLLAPGPDRWEIAVRHDEHVPVVHVIMPSLEPLDLGEIELPRRHLQKIRLVDEDGEPVAGFRLVAVGWMSSLARERWGLEARRAETGEDGRAAFPRLADESLIVGGAGGERFLFEPLKPDTETVRLVLRDRPREARATDFDGRPLEGTVGYLLLPNMTFGPSGEDGVLNIPYVPMTRFEAARGAGSGPVPLLFFDEGSVHHGRVAPVETEDGLVVRLPETREVLGQVLDEETGEGFAGALVSTDVELARSGRGGAFTVRCSPGRDAWVSANAAGYAAEGLHGPALDLSPEKEIRIRLRKTTGLSGRVVNAAGTGISGARVRIRVDSGTDSWNPMSRSYHLDEEVVADDEGQFRLTGLTDSVPYLVRASAPGYSSVEVMVAPLERGTPAEPLEISLQPGRTASGTLLDPGGQPVAGGRVRLFPSSFTGSSYFNNRRDYDERVLEAVSDGEGRFELVDLRPGSFRLRVESPGFAPLEVSGVEVGDQPTADLGVLHLETGAELEGRVLDGEGQPVAGALVSRFETSPRPPGESTPFVHTDSQGWFRLSDLARSVPVSLLVSAEGYTNASLNGVSVERDEPLTVVLERGVTLRGRVVDVAGRPVEAEVELSRFTRYSHSSQSLSTGPGGGFELADLEAGRIILSATNGESVAKPVELELRPGESRDVEIVLRPAAKVLGTVLGPAGEAVAGARIEIWQSHPGEIDRDTLNADRMRATTFAMSDGDGRFALSGLTGGTYRLHAEHPDHGSVNEALELARGAVRELQLEFEDRYGDLSVEGRVVDELGAGVEGAAVELLDDRGSQVASGRSRDGHFEIRAPRPGVYTLVAESPELAAGRSEPFEVSTGGVRGLVLELGSGATITGRVLGLEAPDFARVRILAFLRGARVSREGVVDREGRYRISHLASGDWTVSASLRGSDRSANGRARVGPAGDVVRVDLELAAASRVAGRVLLDGEPLSAGTVRALCGNVNVGAQKLGIEGRFEFAEVPEGDCLLRVSGENRAVAGALAVEVPVSSGLLVELETGTLSGTVSSAADRQPIWEAQISVRPKDRNLPFFGPEHSATETARSDAAGRFAFPAITPGLWLLTVEVDGYATLEREIKLTEFTGEVEVLLRPTAPVVLMVRSANGSVPTQVSISVLDGRGGAASSQLYRPDAEGRVVLRRLAPEVRRLRVTGGNGDAAEVGIEVRGEPVPVFLAR